MEEFLEDNKKLIDDRYLMATTCYNLIKKQKKDLDDFCVKTAALMDQLKTDEAKQELAELTQTNFKTMIEMEMQLAQLEKAVEELEWLKGKLF